MHVSRQYMVSCISARFTKRHRVESCRLLAFILATLAFRRPYFKFRGCATTLINEESTFFEK